MPANTNIKILGAKEAIRSLNKLEPGLRKQFAADATRIAQPAIIEAQNRYRSVGWGSTRVSGVSRNWSQNERQLLPWSATRAARSVKIRLQGDRRVTAVILIEQRDAGTAILESAGRKNPNGLGTALGFIKPRTTRVLGPATYSKRNEIQGEMEKAVLTVTRRVQKELN
jgi:hypothetical protein